MWQFQQRQMSIEVDIVDKRSLSSSDVFASTVRATSGDESLEHQQQQTLLNIDLVDLAESLLPPDFNLTAEVQKVHFKHNCC